ncbi:MAG: DUF2807 domain-containing protein [Bacteroidales bacterium]|nr:DUF2807 domain-containing protein [Bacteroidales bacterium]
MWKGNKVSWIRTLALLLLTAGLSSVVFGKTVTEKRLVGSFNSIYNTSFLDVRFVQSSTCKVLVTMENSSQEQVVTVVEKGVLRIYVKGYVTLRPSERYRVVVYAPFLVEACNEGPGVMDLGNVTGSTFFADNVGDGRLNFSFTPYEDSWLSSKVRMRNRGAGTLSADCDVHDVEIESEGGGLLEVTGTAVNLWVTNTGEGDVNTTDLVADYANVKLDGLGGIYVNVSVKTWVSADGGGLVEIFGDSEVVEY